MSKKTVIDYWLDHRVRSFIVHSWAGERLCSIESIAIELGLSFHAVKKEFNVLVRRGVMVRAGKDPLYFKLDPISQLFVTAMKIGIQLQRENQALKAEIWKLKNANDWKAIEEPGRLLQ